MPDLTAQFYSDVEISRAVMLIALAALVYDYLLTLNMEIELVWGSRWTMGKVLFLLNRYFSLILTLFINYAFFTPSLSDEVCDPYWFFCFAEKAIPEPTLVVSLRFFKFQGWTSLISIMLSELLLQLRIYALWQLSKRILCLLVVSYLGTTVAAAIILQKTFIGASAQVIPIPNGAICLAVDFPKTIFRYWIPPLFFETLLCILAIVQAVRSYNSVFFLSTNSLIYILVTDSVLYYVGVIGIYLGCLLVWAVSRMSLVEGPLALALSISYILANRIVLNLRVAENFSSPKSRTIETMLQFQNPDITVSD